MRWKVLLPAVALLALGCQSAPLPSPQSASVQDSIALSVAGPATVEFKAYRHKGDGQDLVAAAIVCPLGLLLNPLTAVVVVTHCVGTGLLAAGGNLVLGAPRLDLHAVDALVESEVETDSLEGRMAEAVHGYAARVAPGFEFDGSGGQTRTLEISNIHIVLHSDGSEPIRIAPQIAATVRLIGAAGDELDRFEPSLFAPTQTAEALLAEDGVALQAVFEVLMECIAERAFDEILLVQRDPGPVAPGDSLVPDFALKPLSPVLTKDHAITTIFKDFAREMSPRSFALDATYQLGLRDSPREYPDWTPAFLLSRARVTQLTPTFQWEAEPREWRGAGPHDVAYDFRIYLDTPPQRTERGGMIYDEPRFPGASRAVYARYGLREPRHRVEQDLQACTHYRWTVRARWAEGTRNRATEWMGAWTQFDDPRLRRRQVDFTGTQSFLESALLFYPPFTTPSIDGSPCP